MVQNWDDIYDPSRPNNYEDYKNSDEKIAEVREWKDRLYAHRMRARSSDLDSDEEYSRPMNRMSCCCILFVEMVKLLNGLPQGNSLLRALLRLPRISMLRRLRNLLYQNLSLRREQMHLLNDYR